MLDPRDSQFYPLREMLPDERIDEIGRLFDNAANRGAGEDQWRLSALAVLLHCLESDDPEFSGVTRQIPILTKLQALQAAYQLGLEAADRNLRSL